MNSVSKDLFLNFQFGNNLKIIRQDNRAPWAPGWEVEAKKSCSQQVKLFNLVKTFQIRSNFSDLVKLFQFCFAGRPLSINLLRQAGDGFSTFWHMFSGLNSVVLSQYLFPEILSWYCTSFPYLLNAVLNLPFSVLFENCTIEMFLCESKFN